MLLFDQAGPANTADVIQQVCTAAGRQPVGTIVVASNTGATARQLLDALESRIHDVICKPSLL